MTIKKWTVLAMCVAGMLMSWSTRAQKYAISTNLVDCAFLGTMNLDASASVARHFTVTAGIKYNPWEFHTTDPDMTVRNQMTSFSAGLRYWPWYVYSGWWVSMKGQYKEYSLTGIWRPALEEAKAVGCIVSAGYSLMIGSHFNVEFGIGGWAGRLTEYTLYCCPNCMDIRDSGPRGFVRPDDIYLSVSYVF